MGLHGRNGLDSARRTVFGMEKREKKNLFLNEPFLLSKMTRTFCWFSSTIYLSIDSFSLKYHRLTANKATTQHHDGNRLPRFQPRNLYEQPMNKNFESTHISDTILENDLLMLPLHIHHKGFHLTHQNNELFLNRSVLLMQIKFLSIRWEVVSYVHFRIRMDKNRLNQIVHQHIVLANAIATNQYSPCPISSMIPQQNPRFVPSLNLLLLLDRPC